MTDNPERLADQARAVLGDDALAARWLTQESPLFGGRCPVDAVATAEGRRQVVCQLSWFAGTRPPVAALDQSEAETLADLLNDPIMDLVLESAGTGPEDLLRLCRAA